MGMKPAHVGISWDEAKGKWLVRVEVGTEVIGRHRDLPRNADEAALREAAANTAKDEGYQVDVNSISVAR